VPSRPAKQGDIITLYGIGFGPTTPDPPAGQITQTADSFATPAKAYFSDDYFIPLRNPIIPATVKYAGLAPGIAGLYQFNVVVPSVPSGPATQPSVWAIEIEVGNLAASGYIATTQ
jgi:uncharacterized protein (TIGR03437 family)